MAVPANQRIIEKYPCLGYGDIQKAGIIGFYTLASAFVYMNELPAELAKRYPSLIPITRLGRLAVRSDMQSQGLSRILLADAINRAHTAAQSVGSAGIFVDVKYVS